MPVTAQWWLSDSHRRNAQVAKQKAKKLSKSKRLVKEAFHEVSADEPSTVTRAKHFGPGGKPAMLAAVALSKAREAGARIPKKKRKH